MCACDACEGGCNGMAGMPAKGGVVAGLRWRWLWQRQAAVSRWKRCSRGSGEPQVGHDGVGELRG